MKATTSRLAGSGAAGRDRATAPPGCGKLG